jgi:hypothetical protein
MDYSYDGLTNRYIDYIDIYNCYNDTGNKGSVENTLLKLMNINKSMCKQIETNSSNIHETKKIVFGYRKLYENTGEDNDSNAKSSDFNIKLNDKEKLELKEFLKKEKKNKKQRYLDIQKDKEKRIEGLVNLIKNTIRKEYNNIIIENCVYDNDYHVCSVSDSMIYKNNTILYESKHDELVKNVKKLFEEKQDQFVIKISEKNNSSFLSISLKNKSKFLSELEK